MRGDGEPAGSFQVSLRLTAVREARERTRGSRRKPDRVIAFCNQVTPSTSRDTGNYWKIARRPVPAFSPTRQNDPGQLLVTSYRARKRPTLFESRPLAFLCRTSGSASVLLLSDAKRVSHGVNRRTEVNRLLEFFGSQAFSFSSFIFCGSHCC